MADLSRGIPGYVVERHEPDEIASERHYDYARRRKTGEFARFECARCHALRNVDDGSGGDEIDPDGTFCSACWFELLCAKEADRG